MEPTTKLHVQSMVPSQRLCSQRKGRLLMRSKIGKTSTIDVSLGKTGEDAAVFLDVSYTNDNYGGNQNQITLEIKNVSGNDYDISYDCWEGREKVTYAFECADSIKIKIRGTIELSEFLQGLQMILDAEKMSELMDPGY